MEDSAVVLVMLVVTFVMGAIVALFIGAMVLYSREDRARTEREVRDRHHPPH